MVPIMTALSDYSHNDLTSLSVKICERSEQNSQTCAYKLRVVTKDSERIPLIIWKQSPAADLDWTVGEWYHVEDVLVKKWSEITELNATKRTTANRVRSNTSEGATHSTESVQENDPDEVEQEQSRTKNALNLDSLEFIEADLAELDVPANETPDSRSVVQTFEHLREGLTTILKDAEWGQRYVWEENFRTPYIGPNGPNESTYVWLGLIDSYYEELPRAANALQFEFGVDAGSASGFLDRGVIWGILLGPWANDEVVESAKESLRAYSSVFAQFLAENDDYVLVTKNDTLVTPTEDQLEAVIDDIDQGLAVTRDFELTDLPDLEIPKAACETLFRLTPLYRILAGIKDAPPVTQLPQLLGDTPQTPIPSSKRWDIESLGAATSLDTEDVEDAVNRLTSAGCTHDEAITYVRRYLTEMLQGEGLFAVYGVGPSSGRTLVEAGVTTIEELRAATPQELSKGTELSSERIQRLQEAAQTDRFSSLDPGDEQLSERLLNSTAEFPRENTETERPPKTGDRGEKKDDQLTRSGTDSESTTESPSSSRKTRSATSNDDEQEVLAPAELPVPDSETFTVPGGDTVFPNYLSEYYESFRSAKRVLELVFQLSGTDIDPENRRDPRVQYYVLLDACTGFGDVSTPFTGYGPQHQDKLPFSIRDYRKVFGDAEAVEDYRVINVEPFSDDTHELLYEKTNVDTTREFVRPCVPGTNYPIPELPGSFEELEAALRQLATFPAYPPLPSENGTSDRTIPIADIYRTCFEDLDRDHQVNLTSLTASETSPPTGPVPAATPTSQTEAESTLLDFGRLSHLFRRVNPPADSPANRALNVFALDWYRPNSPSFNALKSLAKHGEDDPIDTFRPRLQDLLHRRFLLDTWDYDYITVFPGHEEGSLSPQLVELAQDAVVETDILYTPLLDRTETVERQREKSEDERRHIAIEPSASLRARGKLNGDAVILFDDICTTGSSLLAGAHLLRQAGADRVICLTLGLTPGGSREDVKEITDPEAPVSEIVAGVKR